MGIGIQSIHHIGISVPDLDHARRFYIDLLGAVEDVLPLAWRDNPFIDAVVGLPGSSARQFMCRLGKCYLEVFEYEAPRSPPQDADRGVHQFGYTHFAIQVDDILATHARLVAAGVRVHAPPSMAGITVHADGRKTGYAATYCRDWFGNVFEIMEIHETDDMPRV